MRIWSDVADRSEAAVMEHPARVGPTEHPFHSCHPKFAVSLREGVPLCLKPAPFRLQLPPVLSMLYSLVVALCLVASVSSVAMADHAL